MIETVELGIRKNEDEDDKVAEVREALTCRCHECGYFDPLGGSTSATRGFCRRYAPRPTTDPRPFQWPLCDPETGGCGEGVRIKVRLSP